MIFRLPYTPAGFEPESLAFPLDAMKARAHFTRASNIL
jgi:hypothetical protein